MNGLRSLGRFLYDFVIGDDWTVAVGVVLLGAATAGFAAADWPAWWLPPIGVVGLLWLSLRRATR